MGEKRAMNATLARLGQSIYDDIGQAAIRSENAKAVAESMEQFVGVERTMTATTEHVRKGGRKLEALKKEVFRLETAPDAAGVLSERLDQCLELLNGPRPGDDAQSFTRTQSPSSGAELK